MRAVVDDIKMSSQQATQASITLSETIEELDLKLTSVKMERDRLKKVFNDLYIHRQQILNVRGSVYSYLFILSFFAACDA